MKIALYFEYSESNIWLEQVHVRHPLLDTPRISQRAARIHSFTNAFSWSSGVKALCLFFVRAKLVGPNQIALEGRPGSPAATLEYALAKQPAWLEEMFGLDRNGVSLLRRALLRENPELKRPGPVRLGIRGEVEISLSLRGERVENKLKLDELSKKLSLESNPGFSSFSRERVTVAEREIAASFAYFDPMNRQESSQHLRTVLSSPRLRTLLSTRTLNRLYTDLAPPRAPHKEQRFSHNLRIWVSPWELASILLLKQLPFPKELDFSHLWSLQMTSALRGSPNPPEFAILGLGSAASLLKEGTRSSYSLLALMPPLELSLLLRTTWVQQNKKPGGRIPRFPAEFCSTGLFFSDLFRSRKLRREDFSDSRDFSYDRAFIEQREGDESVVALHQLPQKLLGIMEDTDTIQLHRGWMPSLLMCRRDVDPELQTAVQFHLMSTWTKLRRSRAHLRRSLSDGLGDENYQRALSSLMDTEGTYQGLANMRADLNSSLSQRLSRVGVSPRSAPQ